MIGLMDCNNFFVSCERLFRPDLLGKPVAVLSSNDGCFVARSQEVKDLGIPMGIPYFQVKDMCVKHDITLFSSNFTLYRDISARVMQALKSEFSTCEVYSVDEAFFSIDPGVTEEELVQVRKRIMQKTGIPVSIGVASTKTLAKVANGIAKKGSGVYMLDDVRWEEIQGQVSCGSVWGIGRQTTAFLSKNGIYTVADLKRQDMSFIRKTLGVVGERLYLELSGVPVYRISDAVDGAQQSYASTRSFGKTVKDKMTLMSALGYHVAQVALKLRSDQMTTSQISIIIRGSRFGSYAGYEYSRTELLSTPTDDTALLTKEALRLLEDLYDPEIPYKKAGFIASRITPNDITQASLFDKEMLVQKKKGIDVVTDALNTKFGRGTVSLGIVFGTEKWQEKSQLKSPEYTTRWGDLVSVKAS